MNWIELRREAIGLINAGRTERRSYEVLESGEGAGESAMAEREGIF